MKRRKVVWFSCGVTSAVAAKIAVESHCDGDGEIVVVYCDTGSEHSDSKRFLRDCGEWLGVKIETIRSKKFPDIWEVFERTGWLVGPSGARCTTEMKKIPRKAFQQADDIQIFGMDVGEIPRADRLRATEFEVDSRFPLIEAGISKRECVDIISSVGIRIPAMYLMG